MSLIVSTCFLLAQGRSAIKGGVVVDQMARVAEGFLEMTVRDYAMSVSSDPRAPQAAKRVQIGLAVLASRTSHDGIREAVIDFEQRSRFSEASHQVVRILFNVVFNDAKPGSPLAFATVDVQHHRISWPVTHPGNKLAPMSSRWDTYRKQLGFRPKEQIKELSRRG